MLIVIMIEATRASPLSSISLPSCPLPRLILIPEYVLSPTKPARYDNRRGRQGVDGTNSSCTQAQQTLLKRQHYFLLESFKKGKKVQKKKVDTYDRVCVCVCLLHSFDIIKQFNRIDMFGKVRHIETRALHQLRNLSTSK